MALCPFLIVVMKDSAPNFDGVFPGHGETFTVGTECDLGSPWEAENSWSLKGDSLLASPDIPERYCAILVDRCHTRAVQIQGDAHEIADGLSRFEGVQWLKCVRSIYPHQRVINKTKAAPISAESKLRWAQPLALHLKARLRIYELDGFCHQADRLSVGTQRRFSVETVIPADPLQQFARRGNPARGLSK